MKVESQPVMANHLKLSKKTAQGAKNEQIIFDITY